jgi:hypothetical protein
MAKRRKRDPEREERIHDQAIVDAYGPEEQAIGWYYYLEEKIEFPFVAKCTAKRTISPLRVGDEVEVLAMASADECRHEMFVMVRWEKDRLGVPLSQLRPVREDEDTTEAVEDWRYWVEQGYEL